MGRYNFHAAQNPFWFDEWAQEREKHIPFMLTSSKQKRQILENNWVATDM